MILIEKYNLQAADITEKIIDNVRNKKNINKEFPIGDLFGLNPEQVTIKTGVFNMPDAATTNFDWKESFPGNIKILVQYLYLNKSKERLESLINHEVNHIMSYLRSNGESIKKYWKQSPKGIKNRYSPADEGYSYRGIKYFKTSEEINSFYNTFCTLMKGKKFNTLEELRAFLKKNIKDDEELVDYYLKNNQETKKHFIRNFYKDGFLEDNFKKLVKEEINIIKLNILKENKMKFTDVKDLLINEEEITTVYKTNDYRIVKEKGTGEAKFSAIFADVPRDKISSNVSYPYIAGTTEGANIEKITLMPNDIFVVFYTNNKTVKYTQVALDKKGNGPLKNAVEKLLTAREKS
jgi:hypothetical protein